MTKNVIDNVGYGSLERLQHGNTRVEVEEDIPVDGDQGDALDVKNLHSRI